MWVANLLTGCLCDLWTTNLILQCECNALLRGPCMITVSKCLCHEARDSDGKLTALSAIPNKHHLCNDLVNSACLYVTLEITVTAHLHSMITSYIIICDNMLAVSTAIKVMSQVLLACPKSGSKYSFHRFEKLEVRFSWDKL